MKYIVLLTLVLVSVSAVAEDDKQAEAIQVEDKSVLKGLFYKVWGKFKTMSPKDDRQLAKNTRVTAGIRGAETTGTILQPYWKDDKTSDAQFMQQLEGFSKAQLMVDKGDLLSANKAFSGFIEKWPESDLKPNAEFAEAFTLGALGEAAKSREQFKVFIKSNPNHPLISDANAMIAELR